MSSTDPTTEDKNQQQKVDQEKDRQPIVDTNNNNNNPLTTAAGTSNTVNAPDSEEPKKESEEKKDDGKTEVLPPVPWSALFRYADKWDVTMYIIGIFFSIVSGGGMPAFSELFGRLINEISSPASAQDSINNLAAIMVYIGIGRLVAGFFAITCFMIPCERQTHRIRSLFVDALLRQDMAFHDKTKPGNLTAALVGDIQLYRNGTNDKLSMGIIQLSMFICGYGLAFYRSWELTLVSLSVLPLVAITAMLMRKFAVAYVTENRKSFANAGDISDEAFQNFRTLQILGLEESTIKRFSEALEEGRWSGLMKDVTINLGMGLMFFVMFCSYALTFWYSSRLILDGEKTIGELVTVFFSLLMASFGIVQIAPTIQGLSEASGAMAKVYSVLDAQPTIVSGTKKIPDDQFKGEIVFEDVEFRYPTKLDMPLLNNFNLKIEAGERVAFSGQSGNGKSTCIGLIQRLYDPIQGRVLVDGVDLKELDLEWFRTHVAVVSQEPVLFSGTLKENVKFGKPDASDDEVIAACKMAAIHDTIMNLPDQYDTNSGSVGSQLSGGQKQRIAIARALIKKPRVLLLDEATSALDRQSEVDVQKAIDDLVVNGKFTVIVIAHRLATIATCDKIHFIERDENVGSEIVESGSYQELMAMNGHFASMASRQSKSAAAMLSAEEERELLGEDERILEGDVEADDEEMQQMRERSATLGAGEFTVEPTGAGVEIKNTSFTGSGGAAMPRSGSAYGTRKKSSRQNTATIFVPDDDEPAKKKKKDDEEEDGKKKVHALQGAVDEEVEKSDASLSRVAGLMDKKKIWMVIVAIFGSLMAGAVMPLYAKVFSEVIAILSSVDHQKIRDEITLWLCLFIAVAGCALIGHSLQSFYSLAGEGLTTEMRIATFRSILRQDATFFDQPGRDPGGLQSLLSGDCESVHQMFGPAIGPNVQLVGTLGVGLGFAFAGSWKLALVLIATMPALMFAGAMRSKIQQGFSKPMDEKNPAATIFGESMRNIRTVVAFNAADRQRKSFEDAEADNLKESIHVGWIAGLSYGWMQFCMQSIFALGLWYGGKLMIDDGLTFDDVMICLMAVVMAGIGAGESAGLMARQRDAIIGAKRVFAVEDRIPDVNISAGGADNNYAASPEHNIEFKETSFTYPARPKMPVLKGFSQKILGGKKIGLIGATGSGKSTIISLVSRFYDPCPEKDSIYVDGDKLRSLDLLKWREGICAVFQEPSLFAGSVKENILLGVKNPEEVTEEELITVCKRAAIYDTIMEFPEKWDTQVGMRGCMLSGGQKQRVAIARALLRRSSVLLMDEATSALDNETEALVMDGIDAACKEHAMTTISVAHRLSTIKNCDLILLLDGGVVLESGSHDELIALGKEYKKRWDLFTSATEQ